MEQAKNIFGRRMAEEPPARGAGALQIDIEPGKPDENRPFCAEPDAEECLTAGKPNRGKHERKTADRKQPPTLLQEILYFLIKLTLIALAVTLIFTFMFGIVRYNSSNMSPAMQEGDLIVFYRLDKEYKASDAIVVKYNDEYQIQRVIAVAGDTVDITEGGLMVNGAYQNETRVYTETYRYEEGIDFPLTVPEGEVFVLSDNRTNAVDSRLYGTVRIKDTYGSVMSVLRRRNI